ncbi:RHS repeat-associated core domain-containing protein [Vibrio genomosp. F10 str. 9ZC157]|uniref:RHS repeat-associated core domain-containing protein n=1 Tax=Vibrio genomosp. F10 TaxID=723171 RepID=UPI0003717D3D|nr:RHS repeat-associated core domain-containing protein [Vibrio genomosp. F10 str. 9ZC157]
MMQSKTNFNVNRRRLLKQAGAMSTLGVSGITMPVLALSTSDASEHTAIKQNPLGFNGERQDPVTGHYHLGKGCRLYNPRLMRFHSYDSMSPFGKGGTNGYAYCLGDPVNQRDPSGHFALLSILIGAIVGAVVGAGVSAASEGIQMAINPDHKFDWKQVVTGAAVGFITGGIGIAAAAPKAGAQLGLTIVKSAATELFSVPINTATALSMQPNASKVLQRIGQALGYSLAILGVGYGVKGAVKLGKDVFKGRVVKTLSHWERGQKFYDKHITLRQAIFTGGGIASGISSASSGIVFNTRNHLGQDSRISDGFMRFFHYGSSISGALGSRYLNPIKNIKLDPGGYFSGRFTDLSHVTGAVALFFTEPGSEENRLWNTVSFLTGTTSLYTLNTQNHLKHFNKVPVWEKYGISQGVWGNVSKYNAMNSSQLHF